MKIQIPEKPAGARYAVLQMMLRRDQLLEISFDYEAEPLAVTLREMMPPRVNFERLEAPTRAEELVLRTAEWALLEAKRFPR